MSFAPWPDQSPDQMEKDLLETWKAERLFQRTLDANRDGKPFVFYEGPPTANGRPGIHHVFSRTIKDLVCRYHAMQGKSVTRIAGWDTHGLPVEIEVEKQLGLTGGKKAIEQYGVEKFNAKCRENVFTYKQDWEQLSDRIAYWLDYDHPYITYSNDYVESVWWLLSRLYEKKMLYRGHRVLPYCPRCGTALSSHELALGYEKIHDRSIYVAFPLEDGSGRELIVWTTTPWTLPSNVAVAVHPDLEYGTYSSSKHPGRKFITAVALRARLDEVLGGEIKEEAPAVLGSALTGLRYQRPLNIVPLPADAKHSVVITGDFVTADTGSGIVHMAPAFGADDYAAGQKHGLALLMPVAPDGTFRGTGWPELEGKLVTEKDTNELIIRRLKADGRWLHTEQYEHDYPHCWRCSSKLIYYARDSWFVRTSSVKERMLEVNRAVNWSPPEVGAGRFGEWLANNVDWALSRDRYWGTPLPVWVCDKEPSHVEVIGSYARLADRWGKPLPEKFDPHKPYIDSYSWQCSCGGVMRRAAEVIDTWFDSGSMPYAQWHYPFEHEAEFKSHFPADYICEGVDQTRGWFYSLLAIAVTVFDSPAYRNVIVNGLVLDAQGQKMSKTRGNVVDPWEMIREFGADAVRLYLLASSQVWAAKPFDRKNIPQITGNFIRALRETYRFFALYADREMLQAAGKLTLADRWILSRLDSTIEAVRASYDGYDVTAGTKVLMAFVVDDVSNWYVRLNRGRFWAPDAKADPAAVATLHHVLTAVSRLLAPSAPFMSDWLHRSLTGGSVHLAPMPVPSAARDQGLESAMDAVRRLSSLSRAARETVKLGVRQPLSRLLVAIPASVDREAFAKLTELLRNEVNVKAVEVVESDTALVRLRGKANFRALGKRFGKQTPAVAAAVSRLTPEQLQVLEGGGEATLEVDGSPTVYLSDEVVVEREVATDLLVQSDGPYVAALDPRVDPALRDEGLAREIVHHVQRLRREAGYRFADRIELGLEGPAEVLEASRAHAEFIRNETLARRFEVGSRLHEADLTQDVDLDGRRITLSTRRYEAGRGSARPQPTGK
ncbi:MAG TPA: isoleucine--tRNA ligase [Gemmatimonadales bacterium]